MNQGDTRRILPLEPADRTHMFWVYILQNSAGKFYIGHSNDLEGRVLNHNRTDKLAGKFTRKNGPWILVWCEQHADRSRAMQREREIKDWKSARMIRERLFKNQSSSVVESRLRRD